MSEYRDNYLDLMQPEQAVQMRMLIDKAYGIYEDYETIVLDFNDAVRDLQQRMLDS